DRLEGPVSLRLEARRLAARGRGPRRPLADPGGEVAGNPGVEPLAGRHLEVGVLVADRLDQQARSGVARHDRRPMLAALDERLARIHPQAAAGLLAPVAGEAR